MDERRAADEWMRNSLSDRLTAIEVAQKLYHDEIKSITERLHDHIEDVAGQVKNLNGTVFGSDKPGILEQIRGLMWKFGMAATFGFGIIAFTLKLLGPTINKIATRLIGEDPVQEYIQQSTKKRLQLFNRKTGEYEYYIQFTPVGDQGQLGQKR